MSDTEELELVGALIGDGHIHFKPPKYYFGFTGNKITDKAYFQEISKKIALAWGKKVIPFESGRGLRIRIYSKELVMRLVFHFSLPFNQGKSSKVKISQDLISKFDRCKYLLRGIFDTDGSVFMANKPGSPNYPSIEITTTSRTLAFQIRSILIGQNFRVAKIWNYKSKSSKLTAYKVPLNGKNNLKKWLDLIGISNPYKRSIALKALGK
jgi:intein/homing endonuclease